MYYKELHMKIKLIAISLTFMAISSAMEQRLSSVQDYLNNKPQVIKSRLFGPSLDLSGLQLTSVDGILNIEGFRNLRILNLANNKLSQLPASIISQLTQLRTLNLSNNQLTNLPTTAFTNLVHLGLLDISKNQLPYENIKEIKEALPYIQIND